jgi:hypothetical protein
VRGGRGQQREGKGEGKMERGSRERYLFHDFGDGPAFRENVFEEFNQGRSHS